MAALAIAVAVLAGCDNVEWGGVRVDVREPVYERADTADALPDSLERLEPLEMPTGPLLFHVRRLDTIGHATIEPVLELAAGGPREVGPERAERAEEYTAAFLERYYGSDHLYALFRDGARVGTFFVGEANVAGSGLCVVLGAEGHVELRPPLDTLSEFVAWHHGTRFGGDSLTVPATRRDMASLSQILARRGVQEGDVPGAWRIRAPADLRALNVGTGDYGLAATFVVGDSLGSGSPPDSAGSVFLVADYAPASGFFTLFFDADWYGPGGKRALRWIDALDLLGDQRPEWLLRGYGDASNWYELVASRDTTWGVVWTSRRPVCEAQAPEVETAADAGR
ncbi:MAG: hypothetical protein GWN99_06730 [Gemmatimonadetes bacterium]|uniref:Uncharacterized protein n=1 Tax=Candidatus Kutchimonas denitrificans TaxID=3056748 RepID=A0AAE4Z627_9BACT|nr:hypothetical protein [Gemmatimonadota bacterium]NIR73708.1 hypothetical protein [Candidatus Kutchimonas denitrificans]NIS00758.1 hypothetical protein [Gemmatimonadota bacterium]NIT66345.1 hypothetical protein [Gemmatimonadota bacterium]NIV22902.1 hypothetical protein [Gemmatimonadota bacterium]